MKLTKFAQSCVLVETAGKRILVDPGYLRYDESLLGEQWKNIDLILITHKHTDHCHVGAVKKIILREKTKLYSSAEVKKAYPELDVIRVKAGEKITMEGVKIEVITAVHGYIPLLKGKEIKENIGFIIDDGSTRAYFTSDTISFPNDHQCDVIFVPVCNHGLVMGPYEAALFAQETGAKLVVPVHYDNPKHPVDLDEVERVFKEQKVNYQILNIGGEVDI